MVLGGTFKLVFKLRNKVFDTILKELCQRIHKLFSDPNNRQIKTLKEHSILIDHSIKLEII